MQPGQVSSELQAREPVALHQGANFYFKPQVNLPQNFIPSHIDALISLMQEHQNSCSKDPSNFAAVKDQLMEILKPFMYPSSDISKETPSKNVFEKENNLEIVKPPEFIPPALEEIVVEPHPVTIVITEEPTPVTELIVIPEASVLPPLSLSSVHSLEEIKVINNGSAILEEQHPTIPKIIVRPIQEPIFNYVQTNAKAMTSERVIIPEAPILPSSTFMSIPSNVKKEIIKEESAITDAQKGVFPTISEIAVRPIQESIINFDEFQTATFDYHTPILSQTDNSNPEEPIITYVEPEPSIAEVEVIPEIPIIPSLSAHDIELVEENMKIKTPIIVDVASKPAIQELEEVIPEPPVLSSLPLHDVPYIVKEEVRKEESETLKEPTGAFPIISEIAATPVQEAIFNYVEPKPFITKLQIIPEAPVLPPLSAKYIKLVEEGMKIEEPVVVDVENKPAIPELEEVIPEAPVLHPLVHQDISSTTKEEVRKEESELLKEITSEFAIVPEAPVQPIQKPIFNYAEPKPFIRELPVIPEAPILPPLSVNHIKLIEEGMKIEEPIVDVESKPATEELEEVIPEAPVLPPLLQQDIAYTIKEEVRKEESELLKEPTSVYPIVPETTVWSVQEPIFNYAEPKPFIREFPVIPEAPILPPLSVNDIKLIEDMKIEEPIIVDVASKPAIQELEEVIPEAPVLPPLSVHNIPYIVKEEARKEESVILKELTSVFPTVPEAAVTPIQEPTFNYAEPKPFIREFPVIPEAPILPPLSVNNIKLIKEGMKIEEPVIVDVESKPAIQETEEVIPEALVLPPLVQQDIAYTIKEEVRKEESELLKEPTSVYPIVPETTVWPVQEPIFNYAEPKLFIRKFPVIPEAPILPPLSVNDIKLIEEDMKIEEPIIVDVASKPAIQELEEVIPEAPVLPPLSVHNIPYIFKEEARKDESVILKELTCVFPTVPEAAVTPIQEPTFNCAEPKPFIREFPVIPEAPILPPLSVNNIKLIKEGMKIEEPVIVDVESKPAIQETEEVIPEAPVLPPLVQQDIAYTIKEEVRKEESELIKEPTSVYPIVPETTVWPVQEPIFNYAEPKPFIREFPVIPEAPILPPLSVNNIKLFKEGLKIEEPVVVDVESKPAIQELEEIIPEAPVLSSLVHQEVPSIVNEEVKKEESIILKEPTDVFPIISELTARPVQQPIFSYYEPKPSITEFQVIPEAPALPPLTTNDIKLVEEGMKIEEPIIVDVESKHAVQEFEEVIPEAPVLSPLVLKDAPSIIKEEVKKEESIILQEPMDVIPTIPEISARPISEPITVSEPLENNNSPVATKVNIEIPILLEESIEIFPSVTEKPAPTLELFQEPEITNSYVLENVSQPKPEHVVRVKPLSNRKIFSYAPFVSNRAMKTQKLTIPKPAPLQRFLFKKHPLRMPIMSFPKLSLNAIRSPLEENKKQFLYPTSYAHDVVEKRIAPNMGFKKYAPPKLVKIYVRSQVPKGPSYL
ncbi:hypothetical protein PYW08_014822 [Mythimna loreyi]|uniref:Uncharacterized protein n=1 Tax=Mythimna loreyi TaxID=667449 RepID=A0ACC2R5D0_9NEOP|nr:hypothetical protein PYW08_014822 [Mythimna loreyi]